MKNWNIGKRITIGFAAVLAIMLALGAFIYLQTGIVRTQFATVAETEVPAQRLILNVQSRVQQILGNLYKHIYSPSPEDMDRLEALINVDLQKNSEALAGLRNLLTSAEGVAFLDKIDRTRAKHRSLLTEILMLSHAAVTPGDSAKLAARARAEFDPFAEEFVHALTGLADISGRSVATASTTTTGAIRSLKQAVVLGNAGAMLIGGLLALFIIRGANRALRQVASTLNNASGQLSAAGGRGWRHG